MQFESPVASVKLPLHSSNEASPPLQDIPADVTMIPSPGPADTELSTIRHKVLVIELEYFNVCLFDYIVCILITL